MPDRRNRRPTPDDTAIPRRRSSVRLTIDADGCAHLSAHGLHHDTAHALESLLEHVRQADVLEDAADTKRRARTRRRRHTFREPVVVATAETPRVHLMLVARPKPKSGG